MSSSRAAPPKARTRHVSLPTLFESYGYAADSNEWKAEKNFWDHSRFDPESEERELPKIANQISKIKLCSSKASKEFALSIDSTVTKVHPADNGDIMKNCGAASYNDGLKNDPEDCKHENKYESTCDDIVEESRESERNSQKRNSNSNNNGVLLERRLDDRMFDVRQWIQTQASIDYDTFDDAEEDLSEDDMKEGLPEILHACKQNSAPTAARKPRESFYNLERGKYVFNKTPKITTRFARDRQAKGEITYGENDGNKIATRSNSRSENCGRTGQGSKAKLRRSLTELDTGARSKTINCYRTATPLPMQQRATAVTNTDRLLTARDTINNKRTEAGYASLGNSSAFSWPSFSLEPRAASNQRRISTPLPERNTLRSLSTDL